jgi:hypothetical protein
MYAKQMTKDISKIHQEEKQIQYQQQQQPSPEQQQQQQQLVETTKALTQALSAFQSSLKSG